MRNLRMPNYLRITYYICGFILLNALGVDAQISSSTCGVYNVALDPSDCADVVMPSDLGGDDVTQTLRLTTPSMDIVANNTITGAHIGMQLSYELIESGSNPEVINCWNYLTVEYYGSPVITCPADMDIYCTESTDPTVNTDLGTATATSCLATPSITYVDEVSVLPCNTTAPNDAVAVIITRTWTATDSENRQVTCDQTIRILRPDMNNIEFPINVSNACVPGSTLSTDASVTGYPTYDPDGTGPLEAINIVPGEDYGYCMLTAVILNETIIDKCGANQLIQRDWGVLNMCQSGVANQLMTPASPQQIEITQSAPVFNAVADVTLSSDFDDCRSTGALPLATLGDLCTGQTVAATDIVIITTVGETTNGGNIPSPGLDVGTHTVTYRATDNCGNVATTTMTVTVEDRIAPTSICDDVRITLAAASGSIAATSFDNGSNDNCSNTVYLKVARLDAANADTELTPYLDDLVVTCADVNETTTEDVKVGFLVFDKDPDVGANWDGGSVPSITSRDVNAAPLNTFNGNVGFCWAFADVENKLTPVISCSDYAFTSSGTSCEPASPSVDVTSGAISDDAANTSGLSFSAICGQELVAIGVSDSYTDWSCASGAANTTRTLTRVLTFYYDTDGTFDRTAAATDPTAGGHEETLTCTQVITITDDTPLVITDPVASVTLTDCSALDLNNVTATAILALLTDAQKVAITGNDCEVLLETYDIQNQNLNTATNTLTLDLIYMIDPMSTNTYCGLSGTHMFTQSITVQNCAFETPDIASVSLPGCNTDGSLSGDVAASLNNQDASAFTFEWAPTGGTAIAGESKSTILASLLTPGVQYTVTAYNPNQTGLADTEIFTIPADQCCVNPRDSYTTRGTEITVNLNTTSYAVTDLGVAFTVKWYLGSDASGTELTQFENMLTATGLQTGTEYFIVIQQTGTGAEACTFGESQVTPSSLVIGQVSTPSGTPVQNVQVSLEANQEVTTLGKDKIMDEVMTDEFGAFEFEKFDTDLVSRLSLVKDGDDREGVSTLDLLRLSRHILGIKKITSPYGLISADVTGNGKISTGDMLLLQRLILGIRTDLPDNTSWRFVKEDHIFDDMNTVLDYSFPEDFQFTGNETEEDLKALNFIAIKVGDLNEAYGAELLGGNSTHKTLSLKTDNQVVTPGALIEVPITAATAKKLYGYQHAYQFDTDKIVFTGIKYGDAATLNDDNFGFKHLSEGVLTTSWFDTKSIDVEEGAVLYTLRFEARSAAQLSEVLSISSEYTTAESYFEDDKVGGVQLNIDAPTAGQLVIANTPNPFKSETQIRFDAPAKGEAIISVSDISGKEVYRTTLDAVKGENQLTITKGDLADNGMYIVKVNLNGATASQKMIMIE